MADNVSTLARQEADCRATVIADGGQLTEIST